MGAVYLDAKGINVTAGQTYRIAIDAPPRGEIIRSQCIQRGGSKSTFSFTFYNNALSCPPGQVATAGDVSVDPTVEYTGQIGPTRSVATAGDRYVVADGSDGGWGSLGPYHNTDGGISNAKGKLYMKFIAGGTGVFDVFVTIKTDIG